MAAKKKEVWTLGLKKGNGNGKYKTVELSDSDLETVKDWVEDQLDSYGSCSTAEAIAEILGVSKEFLVQCSFRVNAANYDAARDLAEKLIREDKVTNLEYDDVEMY